MTLPYPVTALGYVDPPPPDVLDAAREALWSAITHEMLTTDPAAAQTVLRRSVKPGPRRQSSSRPDE